MLRLILAMMAILSALPAHAQTEEWVVAPNKAGDRPLYECDQVCEDTRRKGRKLAAERTYPGGYARCEGPLSPPWLLGDTGPNQWQFTTSTTGVRGLALCSFRVPLGPDPRGGSVVIEWKLPTSYKDGTQIEQGELQEVRVYKAGEDEAVAVLPPGAQSAEFGDLDRAEHCYQTSVVTRSESDKSPEICAVAK